MGRRTSIRALYLDDVGCRSLAIVAIWLIFGPPSASAVIDNQAEAPFVPGKLPAAIRAGKVEFRDASGKEICSFKPKGEDAAKFYDSQGKEIGKLTFSGNKLKAKSADDKPLFELQRKGDKVAIKDAADKELFKIKLKDGDLDVYSPADERIYRIRKKDYGYALEDGKDRTLFRAKDKDGKLVLRNADDETVLSTKDLNKPLSLVFFRIPELTPLQQAACVVFFLNP